ncbi:MAG TPA: hypothetical protein VLE22_22115 [Bryobacteraceae bacterium]|nr:hypothetical protein [Bryobacteraceae bacterium]
MPTGICVPLGKHHYGTIPVGAGRKELRVDEVVLRVGRTERAAEPQEPSVKREVGRDRAREELG